MARFIQVLCIVSLALVSSTVSQQFGTNYNAGDHGRSETISPDGEVQGQYQYTNPEGRLVTVRYRAGKDGYQVENPSGAGPSPNQYQPQQYQPQQQQYQPQPQYYQPGPASYQQQAAPQQGIPDTPEVAAAKAEHFRAVEEARRQQAAVAQQNPQQDDGQYQPQQYQSQPQQPQFNQFQSQPQQPSFFQNFGQNNFQSHPNALPGQNRPAKVTVSQQPGSGFTYSYES